MKTSRISRRLIVLVAAALAAIVPAVQAQAVSDGDYKNRRNGCTGNAFNSDDAHRAEAHCYMVAVELNDATHNYVTIGVPETPDGTNPNALEICIDLGQGRDCALFDQNGVKQEKTQPGNAPNPTTGLRAYFGANDNLDSGEHDSSSQVNNGPSDGGGIQANTHPSTVQKWMSKLMAANQGYVLTHPLPGADAGLGFCADGFCFSAQTQRRVIYKGGNSSKHHDAANYQGKKWDPESCAGPSDGPKDCGGHDLEWWNNQDGTVYAEPGLQVYEDPDPQGSPVGFPAPFPSDYPIPSLYVGTCGFIAGGGALQFPASPFTNKAGQVVVSTGC